MHFIVFACCAHMLHHAGRVLVKLGHIHVIYSRIHVAMLAVMLYTHTCLHRRSHSVLERAAHEAMHTYNAHCVIRTLTV
jgi:hypothetical protein